jgi:NDP-sugar pyrophosphorylase family protein
MKTLLICPSDSPSIKSLSEAVPICNAPVLGQSLVEYWLSHLCLAGVKSVTILAHDRPEAVQRLVGDGARWGMTLDVVPESRQLTPAQALGKYGSELAPQPAPNSIFVMDHLPGMPEHSLLKSYADWFAGLKAWMPRALMPDRVGMRQVKPGIWIGSGSKISPQAQLHAPCWIGQHAYVGAGAIIGPETIVEDGSFIEPTAELASTWVGPDTFVGKFARMADSLAWADTLINWQSGVAVTVPDAFLLCALRRPGTQRASWLSRLADLYSRNKEEVSLHWKQLLIHRGS